MALVLFLHENLGKDKHVESLLIPRLDEGSIPSGSTSLMLLSRGVMVAQQILVLFVKVRILARQLLPLSTFAILIFAVLCVGKVKYDCPVV